MSNGKRNPALVKQHFSLQFLPLYVKLVFFLSIFYMLEVKTKNFFGAECVFKRNKEKFCASETEICVSCRGRTRETPFTLWRFPTMERLLFWRYGGSETEYLNNKVIFKVVDWKLDISICCLQSVSKNIQGLWIFLHVLIRKHQQMTRGAFETNWSVFAYLMYKLGSAVSLSASPCR